MRNQTGRGTFPLFAEQLNVIKAVFTFKQRDAAIEATLVGAAGNFAEFHNILSFLFAHLVGLQAPHMGYFCWSPT